MKTPSDLILYEVIAPGGPHKLRTGDVWILANQEKIGDYLLFTPKFNGWKSSITDEIRNGAEVTKQEIAAGRFRRVKR